MIAEREIEATIISWGGGEIEAAAVLKGKRELKRVLRREKWEKENK